MESILVKFAEYPIVETDRLVLRPVTLDDAEAMFEYASDKENTRYTFPTNQSLEETKNNIVSTNLPIKNPTSNNAPVSMIDDIINSNPYTYISNGNKSVFSQTKKAILFDRICSIYYISCKKNSIFLFKM